MKRETSSGILLIAGALSGLFVMSHHPTARGLLGADAAHQARLNVFVHGMALAAVPVIFAGLLGLSRRLGFSDLAVAALVAWGFGSAAVVCAAVASGFVAPAAMRSMTESQGAESDLYHALAEYTGWWNQGFAKVYVVATFAAILLWSAAIVKSWLAARVAGFVGFALGVGVLAGFFAGLVRLDVHGFGIVMLAQSVWLVWIGALLVRERAAAPAP